MKCLFVFLLTLVSLHPGVSIVAAECIDHDSDGWGWDGSNTCFLDLQPVNQQPAAPDLPCIDDNDDGWGWNGIATCEVTPNSANPHAGDPASTESTAACTDPDNDGWGWNGAETCTTTIQEPLCIDFNGDGYGWNGVATCFVTQNPATPATPAIIEQSSATCIDPDNDGFGWNGTSTCIVVQNPATSATPTSTDQSSASCIDPDNDGFGWNGTESCSVDQTAPTDPPCFDDSGDGYGWNGIATCVVSQSSVTAAAATSTECIDPDNDGWGWNGTETCSNDNSSTPAPSTPATPLTTGNITAASITDLVLLTGQSNALGAQTAYNPTLDSGHRRVFAFTNAGWREADLHQIWDLNWHPRGNPDTESSNNLLLHFGKALAQRDGNRVIGFVLATAPGMPISNWQYQGNFYRSIVSKVSNAINQLPHKSSLDGILWHQGESDGANDDAYGNALRTLIWRFRSEPWFAPERPFICGETKIPPINYQLNTLNSDNDPHTACVRAANLSTRHDGLHFDAPALRTLGRRYADRYYEIVTR